MASLWAVLALLALSSAQDSLLNICMDAQHHKSKPGPEGQLYGQVSCGPVGTPLGATTPWWCPHIPSMSPLDATTP